MIKLSDKVWIGNSLDGAGYDFEFDKIKAILNVAQDLQGLVGWPDGFEYAQVGLIDGPGNEMTAYCAAILCLKTLLQRHDSVLVYDHDGGRAMVVALMYLNLTGGQLRPDPMAWSHWPTWSERVVLSCPRCAGLPMVHSAHVTAFNKMPWGLIEVL